MPEQPAARTEALRLVDRAGVRHPVTEGFRGARRSSVRRARGSHPPRSLPFRAATSGR